MADLADFSNGSFEDIISQSELPVLVDFWAPWCGPCRALAPILEEVVASCSGKLKLFKVNVDEYGELSSKYGIRTIPTLLLFKQGQIVASHSGAMSKSKLEAFLLEQIG